jgi:hypothetical protein
MADMFLGAGALAATPLSVGRNEEGVAANSAQVSHVVLRTNSVAGNTDALALLATEDTRVGRDYSSIRQRLSRKHTSIARSTFKRIHARRDGNLDL